MTYANSKSLPLGQSSIQFHGACDLVFLDNPDFNHSQGMRIHIRTKIVHWWSYVESAVVQIGEDTLEVKASASNEKQYWHNGKVGEEVVDSGMMPFTIGGYNVRFRVRSDTQWQFKIFLENKQEIILRAVKEFLKVDILHHTKESFGSSTGLLGGYESWHLVGRNGTVVKDTDDFGKEWQVHIDEPLLFHAMEEPQHPAPCSMPSTASANRRLTQATFDRDAAAQACYQAQNPDFEDCIADVMAVGDLDLAQVFHIDEDED